MIKKEELSNPNSCLNKARDNEKVFVLLERDLAFASTIIHWVQRRVELGLNTQEDPQIVEALKLAGVIRDDT